MTNFRIAGMLREQCAISDHMNLWPVLAGEPEGWSQYSQVFSAPRKERETICDNATEKLARLVLYYVLYIREAVLYLYMNRIQI